jgi:PAS domain-containing protein
LNRQDPPIRADQQGWEDLYEVFAYLGHLMENLEIDELKKKVQLYETILNNVSSGILITDPEGYVVFFSEAYGRVINNDPKSQIGKYTNYAVVK